MKKVFILFFLAFAGTVSAQDYTEKTIQDSLAIEDKVRRLSLGVKVGVPNIIGFSGEYVSPLLNNRIAPFVDYSTFDIAPEDTEIALDYIEYGVNFYLGEKGKGFYVGLGQGTLSTDLVFNNLSFEEDGIRGTGTGTVQQEITTTNVKLGIKTGGKVYFRLEVGYGFGDIPDEITVTGSFTPTGGGETLSGTEVEEFPTIPGVGTQGILIGNFGFGFSF